MPQWGWNRAAAFPIRQRAHCPLAFYLVRAGSSDRCLPVYNFSQLPIGSQGGVFFGGSHGNYSDSAQIAGKHGTGASYHRDLPLPISSS